MSYNWSPEAIERLRTDRAAGMSFREIEKKWNDGVSRNAVAGKCAALHLPSVKEGCGGYAARGDSAKHDPVRDDELRMLWSRLTLPRLAQHFKVGERTVRTWGQRLRLPSRAVFRLPPMRKEYSAPVVVAKKPSTPKPPLVVVVAPAPVAKPKPAKVIEDDLYTPVRSQRKCQWVTVEKPVMMCSAPIVALGSPWCKSHKTMCFTRHVPYG